MKNNIIQQLNECATRLYKGISKEQSDKLKLFVTGNEFEEYFELMEYTNGCDLFDGIATIYTYYNSAENTLLPNSLVKANLPSEKSKYNIPNKYFVIGHYNFGDLICIDREANRIVQWSHDEQINYLEYTSIYEFLMYMIEDFS